MARQKITRFNKFYEAVPFSGCWLWTGAQFGNGYGAFSYNAKPIHAHRASFLIHVGEIPDGQCVLHRCDVPDCVNPNHLFLGTKLDNARDMIAKGRERFPHHKGSAHANSKLVEPDIHKIRESTDSDAALGREFGVNSSTIHKVRHRKSWVHVA